MRRRLVTRLVLTLLVGSALGGCSGAERGSMVAVAPPPGWAADLAQSRQRRDRYFAEDAASPLLSADRATFDGLDYWPDDPARYFVGPVLRHAEPRRFKIPTTSGQEREAEEFGWIRFRIDGMPQTLQVFRLDGSAKLFLPFRDETTGAESYPAGRYLDLEPAGDLFVVDFNRAYNPSCAYGSPERFACPVTPATNRLDGRLEAGERGWREPDGGPELAADTR